MSIVARATRLISAIKDGWLPRTGADGKLGGLDGAGTVSPVVPCRVSTTKPDPRPRRTGLSMGLSPRRKVEIEAADPQYQ